MRKPTPKSTLLSQLQHHLQSLHISEGREMSSGAVSEEEIRAVLIHKSPITPRDLVNNFPGRIRSKKEKEAFAAILIKMSRIQKMGGIRNKSPVSNTMLYPLKPYSQKQRNVC